jgi:hypothetical protein
VKNEFQYFNVAKQINNNVLFGQNGLGALHETI